MHTRLYLWDGCLFLVGVEDRREIWQICCAVLRHGNRDLDTAQPVPDIALEETSFALTYMREHLIRVFTGQQDCTRSWSVMSEQISFFCSGSFSEVWCKPRKFTLFLFLASASKVKLSTAKENISWCLYWHLYAFPAIITATLELLQLLLYNPTTTSTSAAVSPKILIQCKYEL